MLLTPEQIKGRVDSAWFTIDMNPHVVDTSGVGLSGFFGCGNIWSGQGATTLEMLRQRLSIYPKATMDIDISLSNVAHFTRMDGEDLLALEKAFIARYGYVDKPGEYGAGPMPAPPVLP